jgi:hypothetical protein
MGSSSNSPVTTIVAVIILTVLGIVLLKYLLKVCTTIVLNFIHVFQPWIYLYVRVARMVMRHVRVSVCVRTHVFVALSIYYLATTVGFLSAWLWAS